MKMYLRCIYGLWKNDSSLKLRCGKGSSDTFLLKKTLLAFEMYILGTKWHTLLSCKALIM